MNDELKAYIEEKQKELVNCIEEVCKIVDRCDGDSWQLFTHSITMTENKRATKALNSRLKVMLRKIPNLKVISPVSIETIITTGMDEVIDKYNDLGAETSEVYSLCYSALKKLFEKLHVRY